MRVACRDVKRAAELTVKNLLTHRFWLELAAAPEPPPKPLGAPEAGAGGGLGSPVWGDEGLDEDEEEEEEEEEDGEQEKRQRLQGAQAGAKDPRLCRRARCRMLGWMRG